jgi:hypothetical protein
MKHLSIGTETSTVIYSNCKLFASLSVKGQSAWLCKVIRENEGVTAANDASDMFVGPGVTVESAGICCPDFWCVAVNVVLHHSSSLVGGKIHEEHSVSTFMYNNHNEDGDVTCIYCIYILNCIRFVFNVNSVLMYQAVRVVISGCRNISLRCCKCRTPGSHLKRTTMHMCFTSSCHNLCCCFLESEVSSCTDLRLVAWLKHNYFTNHCISNINRNKLRSIPVAYIKPHFSFFKNT